MGHRSDPEIKLCEWGSVAAAATAVATTVVATATAEVAATAATAAATAATTATAAPAEAASRTGPGVVLASPPAWLHEIVSPQLVPAAQHEEEKTSPGAPPTHRVLPTSISRRASRETRPPTPAWMVAAGEPAVVPL